MKKVFNLLKSRLLSKKFTPAESTTEQKIISEPKKICAYPYFLNKNDANTLANITEYNEYIMNEYDGYRTKQFYLCDTTLLGELITELQNNPTTSYKTYANNLIKSGYIPEKLSILLCDNTNNDKTEVLTSKILNFFKIPTAYYTLIKTQNSLFFITPNNNKTCSVSVDFIPPGHRFRTFSDLNLYPSQYNLKEWFNALTEFNERYALTHNIKKYQSKRKLKEVKKDFAYTYLVRTMLLGDDDFTHSNCGILVEKSNDNWYLAPNFDLEGCMQNFYEFKRISLDTLWLIKEECPSVLTKFITKTQELLYESKEKQSPASEILSSCNIESEKSEQYLNILKENFKAITTVIKENDICSMER